MGTERLIRYLAAILVMGPLIFVVVTHQAARIGTVHGPSVNWNNSFGGGNLQVFASICAGKFV